MPELPPRRLETIPAYTVLQFFNAQPGSMLNAAFVDQHDQLLTEYGLISETTQDAAPTPSPARTIFNYVLNAQEKSRQAATAPEYAVYSPTRLWRDAEQLLSKALLLLDPAQAQAKQFINHNRGFRQCAWQSIRQDISHARHCVRQQILCDRNQPTARPLRPENRRASIAQVLDACNQLSPFEKARLLQQLALQVLDPAADIDTAAQTYIAAASHSAASAAEMIMAMRARQLCTDPEATASPTADNPAE